MQGGGSVAGAGGPKLSRAEGDPWILFRAPQAFATTLVEVTLWNSTQQYAPQYTNVLYAYGYYSCYTLSIDLTVRDLPLLTLLGVSLPLLTLFPVTGWDVSWGWAAG